TGSSASLRRPARVFLAAWRLPGRGALYRGHRDDIGCPQANSSRGACSGGIRLVVWRWTSWDSWLIYHFAHWVSFSFEVSRPSYDKDSGGILGSLGISLFRGLGQQILNGVSAETDGDDGKRGRYHGEFFQLSQSP